MTGIVNNNGKSLDALTSQYVIPASERAKSEEEARRAARDAVLPDIAAIFAAVPNLQRIEVDGITPYFNDGDACEHSQHDPKINGRGEPKYSGSGYWHEEDDADTMPELPRADFDRVAAIIAGMEGALHVAFDTHWTLTFKRSGDGIEWTRDDNTDHD
jgi:hypothetical protein